MTLVRWRPLGLGWQSEPDRELDLFHDQMNRLWDSFFGSRGAVRSAGVFPALNVSEDNEKLYVRAEVPGMTAGDLELITEDNSLILKGRRTIPDEAGEVSWHRREREEGSFHRIATLPVRVSSDKVSATCKDGILTVTLPKAPEAKPNRITVRSA